MILHQPSLGGVLNLAFHFGGFCAGGFARAMYHVVKKGKNMSHFNDFSAFAKADVDIFFRTQEGHDQFIAALKNSTKLRSFTILPSKAQLATDISFRGIDGLPDKNDWYSIQAISAFLGTPEQILGHFDFANCMIGFEKTKVFQGSRFAAAENAGELDIMNWKHGSLLYRVQKYVNNHGYKKMHPDCRKKFVEWVYDTYFTLDEHGHGDDDVLTKDKFRQHVRSLMKTEEILRDEDLLLLCTMFEGTQYNYADAFSELRRRGKAEQRRKAAGAKPGPDEIFVQAVQSLEQDPYAELLK